MSRPLIILLGILVGLTPWARSATVNLKIQATQPGVSQPVCVRAIIKQSTGAYVAGEWSDPSWPRITMRGKAVGPDTVLTVPVGVTQITVGKGPDYLPITITTNLANADQTYTIPVVLQPALDLYGKGWRAGDAHMHFIHGEGEVIRDPPTAFTMCAAGGFNFASFCEEHLGAGTQTKQQLLETWSPYEDSECKLWLGVEEPKNQWGHHVALLYEPWYVRSPLPYHWGIYNVHEQGGISIPVHTDRLFPGRYYDDTSSGTRTWFLFPHNNHLKSYPLDALTGHLLDGWSGVSDAAFSNIKLPPYFNLLDMGYRIPYMADSDFCFDRVNNGEKGLGCWMNFFQLEGQPLTRGSVANAVRKGRVMATTGPLVLFTIDNAISGDTLPADGSNRTVRIEASHLFNPWTLGTNNIPGNDVCKVSQINLYRNGQLLKTWTPNTPTATVTWPITESSAKSYYMVRVVGNDSQWMAGYASPIYFDNAPRPRQPPVFKPLIQGRLYDATSGASLSGTVSCVRYGRTEWTIPTDSQGRFQAYTPIDAQLVATDTRNRTWTQDIVQYEPAFAFCNYLPDNYNNNMAGSLAPFQDLVSTMEWEFPLGYQYSASYVRTPLSADAVMGNFSVTAAPPPTPGKAHSEIVMLLLDKTQVQSGDTINYAAIFRQPQAQTPTEQFSLEWRAWDPSRPRMYNRYGNVFHYNDNPATVVNLGGGFWLRQGSVVVPSWTANSTETSAALKLYATVRQGKILEDAALMVPIGPTRRELLVSTTWDGFPAGWGDRGIGPCSFFREWASFVIRYSDYRTMTVNLNLNGQQVTLQPTADTAHCPDADDAVFYEFFYYDGQCEPQFRNVPFRDVVRTQPAPVDFSTVPVQSPADTSPPLAVAMEPAEGSQVPSGSVPFYYSIVDTGSSDPAEATILLDGAPVVMNTSDNPVVVQVPAGTHTWQVKASDRLGNQGVSQLRTFTAGDGGNTLPDTVCPAVSLTAPVAGSTVSDNVSVTATATDNTAVAGLQFQLNSANLGSELATAPYQVNWNTLSSSNGLHRLTAIARDAAGNRATSALVSVTVNNTTGGGTTDTVWVEDALPAGAVAGADGGDAWTWVSANPAPYSGTVSQQSSTSTGTHQHFFSYASQTLSLGTGDVLFAYVYLNPANTPQELMLQWNNGSWEHRAYWGASISTYGVEGTVSRRFVGPLPPAGQWVRLEVPASLVGLEGTTLTGMAFTLVGGQANWDHAGKASSGTLRLSVRGTTNATVLSWNSQAGRVYHVNATTSLASPNWSDLSGAINASGSTTTWTDTNPPAGTARFYRVVSP